MAAISAAMVKELREKTDAPMMECKKLLQRLKAIWPEPKKFFALSGNKATKAASRV